MMSVSWAAVVTWACLWPSPLPGKDSRVSIHDTNDSSIQQVLSVSALSEPDAEPALCEVVGKTLHAANDPTLMSQARYVVVVIGTPVDEHLNPTFHVMRRFFEKLLMYLVDGQCLILRSTVYPGTTAKLVESLASRGLDVRVAFCPERIAEGKAMHELTELPQIVSGSDDRAWRWPLNCWADRSLGHSSVSAGRRNSQRSSPTSGATSSLPRPISSI